MENLFLAIMIIFIIIFTVTAILTICALPGWIKIPDKYLKVLFSSLLLEVIACILLVVTNRIDTPKQNSKNMLSHQGKNWVILDNNGNISQLSINANDTSNKDSLKGMGIEEFSNYIYDNEAYHFTLAKGEKGYLIKSKNSKYLGKVSNEAINDSLGLLDEINLKNHDFETIKYVKNDGKWNIENGGLLLKEWELEINISGSRYTISDAQTTKNYGTGSFDNRNLHSFRGLDGAYYIIRISSAVNSGEDKQHFVTFMVIRTK